MQAWDSPPPPTRWSAMVAAGPSRWLGLALLVVAVITLPSIRESGFLLDDGVNLAKHAHHGDVWGEWTKGTYLHADPARIGHVWRPIPATLQHLLALVVGRESAVPFRVLTLLLHGLNVTLAYSWARLLGGSERLSAVAALFAGVHPVAIESACWASCLFDVLMTTTILATLLVLGRVSEHTTRFMVAMVGMAVATLSKESALALVPLIGLVAANGAGLGTQTVSSKAALRSGLSTAGGAALGGLAVVFTHDLITGQIYKDAFDFNRLATYSSAWLQSFSWSVGALGTAPLSHGFTPNDSDRLITGLLTFAGAAFMVVVLWKRQPRAGSLAFIGLLSWSLPLVPAALAAELTGTASMRLGYAGIILASSPFAAALSTVRAHRWAWVLVAGWGVVLAPEILSRPKALSSERLLWAAELRAEPTPWALARGGRIRWTMDHSTAALEMWRKGVESAPAGLLWVSPAREWWDLAQASFLSRQPQAALAALDRVAIALGPSGTYPALYSCLRADSLDALGRASEAAFEAERCRPPGHD